MFDAVNINMPLQSTVLLDTCVCLLNTNKPHIMGFKFGVGIQPNGCRASPYNQFLNENHTHKIYPQVLK